MALLFWDGLDSYSTINDMAAARPNIDPGYMVAYGSWPPLTYGAGRFAGNAITTTQWCYWGKIDITSANTTELYTGRAINHTQSNNGLICFWGNNGGGTNQPDVFIYIDSGYVIVNRYDQSGTTTELGRSSAGIFPLNTWHWIEARCKMSSNNTTADGIVEVWLNNQQIISLTSVITKRLNASTCWMGINFNSNYQNANKDTYVDDIYITDTTGPAPWNGRIGDSRMTLVKINSDKGPNQGTTASGNVNHYTAVSDVPFNSADSIIFGSTMSGLGEMFGMTSLPSTNVFSVIATGLVTVATKSDAGNGVFKLSLRTGSNTYNSNTQYLSTSNTSFRVDWPAKPGGNSQWTLAEISAANVGMYIV